jgi:hypothetical protein
LAIKKKRKNKKKKKEKKIKQQNGDFIIYSSNDAEPDPNPEWIPDPGSDRKLSRVCKGRGGEGGRFFK